MSRMIVNPDELLRFASFLDSSSDMIQQRKDAVTQELNSLSEVWRDAKYRRFEQIYEETTAQLDKFADENHDYANHLRSKADIVFEYLEDSY
jgi:uncharacterized protein YukE